MIVLVIFATVILTTIGGLFAIRFKDKLHLILGFSAGAVLGVALFDLLPESIELSNSIYDIQTIMLLVALGFCAYMLIDRLFSMHKHDDDCERVSHNGKLSAIAFILHSFLDGFSIGLAFKISNSVGLVVAVAVLAHKFSDGINTASVLMQDGNKFKSVIKWLIVSSLAPIAGVCLAYFMTIHEATLGALLAIFVGLFIYISASDLIPESHHRHPAIWTTISTIVGMSMILLVTNLVH